MNQILSFCAPLYTQQHGNICNVEGYSNLIFVWVLSVCSSTASPFWGKATVKADFVRVDVVSATGREWSDVHMQVSPKEEVATRPVKPGGIPLDIALIMYDSTSAANFRRKMPNTLEHLTKNLNSILLEGIITSVKSHSGANSKRRCVFGTTSWFHFFGHKNLFYIQ